MDIRPLEIDGAFMIRPRRNADHRGWLMESYNRAALAEAGITADFVQDNLSWSEQAGTVRGLHLQAAPHQQAKLVQVMSGRIADAIVDVRPGSPGFGRHLRVELDARDGWQLFVPRDFLHGFVKLEAHTRVLYKVDQPWSAPSERSVRWDDPDLAIDWAWSGPVVVSSKDMAGQSFADYRHGVAAS